MCSEDARKVYTYQQVDKEVYKNNFEITNE